METDLTIATWNVERPRRLSRRVPAINAALKELAADIIVLTETNSCISPGDGYSVSSTLSLAPDSDGAYYKKGELRVSVYSVYPIVAQVPVTNAYTTVCPIIETPYGKLAVYGTIIGIHGRGKGFDVDLHKQIADLNRITQAHRICYAGDFNVSFCDNYYTKKDAKTLLEEFFSKFGIRNLTKDIPANIDHIAVSDSFLPNLSFQYRCWNENKKLSDHKGVVVTLHCGNSEQADQPSSIKAELHESSKIMRPRDYRFCAEIEIVHPCSTVESEPQSDKSIETRDSITERTDNV